MLAIALWLEGLLICSLWAALINACFARWSRAMRWLALCLGLAPLAFPVALLIFAGRAELKPKIPLHLFLPLLSLTVLSLATIGVLWSFGFSRRFPSLPAASWPRFNLAAALSACAVLLLVSLAIWENEVQQQAATLRRDAEAMSVSLAPPVADRDNAAPSYEAIYKSLAAEGKSPDILDVTSNTLSPDTSGEPLVDPKSPELALYLKLHAPHLALLRSAAGKPNCRFPRDYAQMTSLAPMPEINGLRALGRLLVADARRSAAAGDMHLALTDIQADFVLSQHAAKGPLISFLVGASVEGVLGANLESMLQTDAISSDDLIVLEFGRGASCRDRLPDVLRAEEAMTTKIFVAFLEGANSSELTKINENQHFPWLFQYVLMPVDCAGYRRAMDETIVAIQSDEPYGAIVRRLNVIAAGPLGGMMSAILMPSTQAAFGAAVRCDAQMAAIRTGVAMHRYRAAHGKFPATRDELAAEFMIPADPFDGKPIRFKTTDHGWIVYSIGPDLVDDGGKRYDPSEQKGDIVFEYRVGNK